jgi:hypothetical protein
MQAAAVSIITNKIGSFSRRVFCQPGFISGIFQENDGLRWTVPFTGSALNADIDINMRLRLSFGDGKTLAAHRTSATL